jgi:hypothetical protein
MAELIKGPETNAEFLKERDVHNTSKMVAPPLLFKDDQSPKPSLCLL